MNAESRVDGRLPLLISILSSMAGQRTVLSTLDEDKAEENCIVFSLPLLADNPNIGYVSRYIIHVLQPRKII